MTTEIDTAAIRHRQRVREAMRKYGFTEVVEHIYSKGDVVDGKMPVVACHVPPHVDDAAVAAAAENAARAYAATVKDGPK